MVPRVIEELLEKSIGLKVGTIGKTSIRRAINSRMSALGLEDMESYVARLKLCPSELHELAEDVVVPETWFFRDHYPFVALINHLLRNWDRNYCLRILSMPCSTGEEPYSIAMALLQAGFPGELFRIDAVDISKRFLEHARAGEYRKNSFRSKDLRFRDIYFTRHDKKYVLKHEVRRKVRFLQGNILNGPFVESLGLYDVIFSRNILIYFDTQTRKQVIRNIAGILKAKGILFTGHAEASLFIDSPSFSSLEYKGAFGFVKKSTISSGRSREMKRPMQPAGPGKSTATPVSAETDGRGYRKPAPPAQTDGEDLLEIARKFADQGELDKAAALCEEELEKNGPSTEVFFLRGIIADSKGDPENAMKLLRKAVYLDPRHYESLLLLSLLSERFGDETGARNYRRRALKANQEAE